MVKEVKIALLGFGTIGMGVYELLQKNAELVKERVGIKLIVKKILVRDLKKKREVKVEKDVLTTDVEEISQ